MDQHHSKLNPKFFFLSLGVLATLIASVTAFLNLIFETLNQKFPDALNSYYEFGYNSYNYEGMRSAIATLIIIFPTYLILSYFWRRAAGGSLGRIDHSIKKWMLYLILFLAGIVIVVDLITLVRYFVSGEITARFLLKVAATLVTAKLVGWFYIAELRSQASKTLARVWTIVGLMLAIAAIVWSFNVIGSPKEQRAWRLDERRVQDLQSIQWQIINSWQQKERLPETLDELKDPISSYMVPFDPEFEKGLRYEYRKIAAMTFELCATFSAPMPEGWQDYGKGGGVRPFGGSFMEDVAISSYPHPGFVNDSWDHEAGRACFSRTIDPEIYPPFNNPKSL